MGTATFGQVLGRNKDSQKLILTPRMDKWLLDHPEGVVCTTPEDQALMLKLTSDVSNSQRTARIGASSRGTCKRQQVFRFLGMSGLQSMDSVLQNIFNDGTWRHIRHQLMGVQGGWLTDVEVKFTLPQYSLGTSLDGVNDVEGYTFELKGMRYYGSVVAGNIPPGHMLQIQTGLLASDYERCIYLVEDKGSQDWKEIVVPRDKTIIRQVKDELNEIADSIEDKILPPVLRGCKAGKGDEFRQCPYKIDCPQQVDYPTQPQPGQAAVWSKNIPIGRQHGKSGGLAG